MKKFFKGFVYAFNGIAYAFRTQVNMRFHVFAGLLVVGTGFYFHITSSEWAIIAIAIGLVISAELFNTAIESLTDLATQEIHPLAKTAKDCAAAAVLVCAILAVILGGIIFIPYLVQLF